MINRYLLHGLGVALSGITTPPPLSPLCSDWLSLSTVLFWATVLAWDFHVWDSVFLTRASLCSQYEERTSAQTPILIHALSKPLTGKYYRDLMECRLQIRDGIIILWKQNYHIRYFGIFWQLIFSASAGFQEFFLFLCKCLTLAACQQQVEHDLTNTVL